MPHSSYNSTLKSRTDADNANCADYAELAILRERLHQRLLHSTIGAATGPVFNALDLRQIWPETTHLPILYEQLSDLKRCLDSLRPLSQTQLQQLNESFDIEYTYESNRIEGNTLSKKETYLIVNKGLTIKGKSLMEHLEAVNHQEAIDYIRAIASQQIEFDERTLLDIHALVIHGIERNSQGQSIAGKYRQQNVTISGSDFVPPMFLQVPQLMDDFFVFYQNHKDTMHPVELASEMHERLVTIHPFIDGNGRSARLMMNLLLIGHGYPMTILRSENEQRLAYYDSLELAQTGQDPDKIQFKIFIAQNVKFWLFHYLNLLAPNGSDDSKDKGYYFLKRIEALLV